MFLLDVKQVNKVYQNSTILGTSYYIGQPTSKAVANSEYKEGGLVAGTNWYYWLRSPYADSDVPHSVRRVHSAGYVNFVHAYSGVLGARPAFYINLSSVIFKSETSGSVLNPYKIEDATVCNLISVSIPINATIDENIIAGSVNNATKSITIDVTPSVNATWKLYSDASCTAEIANKVMTLAVGANTNYIKVTAQDSTTNKIYTLTVTRNGVKAGTVSARPAQKAKINFSIYDSKNLSYLEFTVVYSNNSLEINTTDANIDGIFDAITVGDYKVLSHTPISVDSQDPSKRRITIAVQYDANSGYPTTSQLAKLCSINFDIKTISPIGSTSVEISDNTSEHLNCYGMDKDNNIVVLDNPKAGSVNVLAQPVTSIVVNGSSSITVNAQTAGYTAQILPDYATKKTVTWSVSNTAVASIDASGILSPKTNGTVNVIATATDGSGVAGQKAVVITSQKAFLTNLTATTGILSTPFTPFTINYIIYVPNSATAIELKPTFTGGTLKNNGLIWANNMSKSITLTDTNTAIKLDLTQTNLDAVTYTINVIKVEDTSPTHTISGIVGPLSPYYYDNPDNADPIMTELQNYFGKVTVDLYDENIENVVTSTTAEVSSNPDELDTVSIPFELTGVTDGTYVLMLSRDGMCPKLISVTVNGENINVGTKVLMGADMNDSWDITPNDVLAVLDAFSKGDNDLGGANYNVAADINGDGQITPNDVLACLDSFVHFDGYLELQ